MPLTLRANNNSGAAAQFRFEGHGHHYRRVQRRIPELRGRSECRSRHVDNNGSGASHYIRLNGTGVTAHYGWRNDDFAGLGVACRVFGYAVSG